MEIQDFLQPLLFTNADITYPDARERIGHKISAYTTTHNFPSLQDIDIAIIGIQEDQMAVNNIGCANGADPIRKKLYSLFPHTKIRIADLGNIAAGKTIEDTYHAATEVVSFLIAKGIVPIVLGGSQDLTFACYKAYEKLQQIINLFVVDNMFDLGTIEEPISSQSYLNKIITQKPNYLFNYTNIGYQTYFVDQESISLMDKLYFDVHRLGLIRSQMEEVEPLVRDADMMSIDISAVRNSDAPGNGNATPNGFYGDEICRITRYAGLSDKLSCIGFYEYNPILDINGQTALLTAQMIWYFIEGFYNRKSDFPYKDKENYKRYYVPIQDHAHEIIFYKSKKSERWWMEVPCPANMMAKYERHYLIPCSYSDYQIALKDEVPERWVLAFHKFSE